MAAQMAEAAARVAADQVRGMQQAMQQAEAGMALFKKADQELDLDVEGATAFKQEQEDKIKEKEEEEKALTGKDNKKARAEISKLVSAMKVDVKYIDACKVVKGIAPPNGHFNRAAQKAPEPAQAAPTSAAAEADMKAAEDKKAAEKKAAETKAKEGKKKTESAGISRAEKDELEKLKSDIIARKAELKAAGKSGGECNKDEQVVAWVARMNELKLKEDPSLAEGDKDKDKGKDKAKKGKGALSAHEQAELMSLQAELETYRQKLIHEFGYSKKDIASDPEFVEMEQKVKQLERRS